MPDDNEGRDESTDAEERPQPDGGQEQARDRGDEDEATTGDLDRRLGDLDDALETREYPITATELAEAYGGYDIETQDGTESLEEVLAAADERTFSSADEVRSQIRELIHR